MTYSLMSSVSYEGAAALEDLQEKVTSGEVSLSSETTRDGHYTLHLVDDTSGRWFELRDLTVRPADKKSLFLHENYFQIWRRKPAAPAPSSGSHAS